MDLLWRLYALVHNIGKIHKYGLVHWDRAHRLTLPGNDQVEKNESCAYILPDGISFDFLQPGSNTNHRCDFDRYRIQMKR